MSCVGDSFPVSTISVFSVLTVSLKRTCRFKRITFRANEGKIERTVTKNLAIWSAPSKSLRKEVGLVDKLTEGFSSKKSQYKNFHSTDSHNIFQKASWP